MNSRKRQDRKDSCRVDIFYGMILEELLLLLLLDQLAVTACARHNNLHVGPFAAALVGKLLLELLQFFRLGIGFLLRERSGVIVDLTL
mmetsp:Transcript_19129/g.32761  ORF Transcript_19129/g.32761 Transcript_19129/m.32761 type:complete len:88 (-) Transcript_19129:964-1227(-)